MSLTKVPVFKSRNDFWIVTPVLIGAFFIYSGSPKNSAFTVGSSRSATEIVTSKPSSEKTGEVSEKLSELAMNLKSQLPHFSYFKNSEVELTDRGLEVTLSTSKLFLLGTADTSPEAQAQITALAGMINALGPWTITVEGHTDQAPVIKNVARYPSNWELSGSRALSIVRIFEKTGIPAGDMVGIGYASSRPKDTRTPANGVRPISNDQDRRILVRIQTKS